MDVCVPQSLSTTAMDTIQRRFQLDSEVTTIIQEIFFYFTFVAIVLFMVHGHQDVNTNFYATKDCESMFYHGAYTRTLSLGKVSPVLWTH